MAKKADIHKTHTKVLQATLIGSAVVLVLIAVIRAFHAPKIHALESADAEPDYGTGIAAFFRRLFKHPIHNSGLTDIQKTKIAVQERIKPKIHCFGHIHEEGGKSMVIDSTTFVNASIVDERYRHVNKPVNIKFS